MTRPTQSEACSTVEDHCITCSDEGNVMNVLRASGGTAVCRDSTRARHDVAVDLVGPVSPGDNLLVHAGVAIRKLDPEHREAA